MFMKISISSKGIWEPTIFNEYGTPVVPARKQSLINQPTSTVRVCGDYSYSVFFREDDLLTCKNQQKTKQNINNTRAQGKIIDDISIVLMKQFTLFPVATGKLTITHDQNMRYTSKYMYK